MVRDLITDEIRQIRKELGEKFNNDVVRIGDDLRRQQRESNRPVVRLPRRLPRMPLEAKPSTQP